MLHYILAQVSIQLIFKRGNAFSLQPCFVASTLGSLNNSLVVFFALVLLCFTGWFFNPFFPGGCGLFSYVFPEICQTDHF